MYEMLSGAPPFYSKDRNLMFKNRIEKQMEIKSWFSTQAISLLKGLLNQDVIYRLISQKKDWDSKVLKR